MNVEIEKKKTECAICGSAHPTIFCDFTRTTNHIHNRQTLTKAQLSLPNDFLLYTLADGRYRVVTNRFIQKGTRFGPLDAAKSFTLNETIQFPLKIFPIDDDDFLEYYLDTSDENTSTWMIFIEPAEKFEEQNLMCYQDEKCIYYISIRDIKEGESLQVWYAPHYATKMGKTVLQEELVVNDQPSIEVLNELVKSQQNIADVESWTCKFCNVKITEVIKFATHLIKDHYEGQLKNYRRGCKSTSKTQKHPCKNEGNHPNSNNKDLKKASIVNREISIGGPLLNSTASDNPDNSYFVMPFNFDLSEDSHIMGVEHFNENSLMTENFTALTGINFDIEEMKKVVVCDICFKNFTSLPNLIQHLKGHTGEYFCSTCNKVFTRKENLNYHSCTARSVYNCSSCNRNFSQEKYYKRHMDVVHNQKFKCKNCEKSYSNKYELTRHNCTVQPNRREVFICEVCKKKFIHQRYLKKHLLRNHKNIQNFLCEICSKSYSTKTAYELHTRTHMERTFECEICHKKFHRKHTLGEHMTLHSNGQFECNICDKKFKTKKYLLHHQKIHSNQKYICDICNNQFDQKSNLTRHVKVHLRKGETDSDYKHQCNFCGQRMKKKSSLFRHVNRNHISSNVVAQTVEEKDNEEKDVLHFLSDNLDVMSDSKDNIDYIPEVDDLGRKHIQVIDNILLNKSEEMGLAGNNFTSNLNDLKSISLINLNESVIVDADQLVDKEVLLSMPDLIGMENNIILGEDFITSLESASLDRMT